jgi:hypothetical protein
MKLVLSVGRELCAAPKEIRINTSPTSRVDRQLLQLSSKAGLSHGTKKALYMADERKHRTRAGSLKTLREHEYILGMGSW